MTIGDYGASVVRTVVSYAWGLVVTGLLQWWTGAPVELADWLGSDMTLGAITAAATAGWYALWRRLEEHVPAWVRRITLGSARSPGAYAQRELARR